MSVLTVRETENYSYDIDTLYGTGWFVRKRDDFCSLLDTGSEVANNQACLPCVSVTEFEEAAENCTYTPRWTEDS